MVIADIRNASSVHTSHQRCTEPGVSQQGWATALSCACTPSSFILCHFGNVHTVTGCGILTPVFLINVIIYIYSTGNGGFGKRRQNMRQSVSVLV